MEANNSFQECDSISRLEKVNSCKKDAKHDQIM